MWLTVMNFGKPLQPLKMDVCKGYEAGVKKGEAK
jgi:hypothetical protein